MKKIIFCLALLGLLFSCDSSSWNDTVITNKSSDEEVTFKFNHTNVFVLPKNEQVTFETKAYQYLEWYEPSKLVKFTYVSNNDGYIGIFENAED